MLALIMAKNLRITQIIWILNKKNHLLNQLKCYQNPTICLLMIQNHSQMENIFLKDLFKEIMDVSHD